MEFTCISCPVGCRLHVEVEGDKVISVEGNACPRGVKYANQEAVAPQRIVTAVVHLQNSKTPLSVKTEDTIPKEKIFDVMVELNNAKLYAPIKIGDVVLQDICQTGVNIIATKTVKE
ncbi:MAG: DUF1667 domain-containing protein [Eubacteriales bacterium]|nr:DUF1667 domain-containing protein [Eubacteriales bacterium]